MKFVVRSAGIFLVLGLAPYGCAVHEPELGVVQSLCPRMGLGIYEFQPVGADPNGVRPPAGSFEPELGASDPDPNNFFIPADSLIIDDDDLTDDYDAFREARTYAEARLSELSAEVAIWEQMDPMAMPTPDQQVAIDAINEVIDVLAVGDGAGNYGRCPRLTEALFRPAPGDPIRDLTWANFVVCKDKYNESGDGVVATFDLTTTGNPQDAELASCVTVGGGDNHRALNFWSPLTAKESEIEGLPAVPRDGHTYSGVTVPLFIADYQRTADFSMWEGIAFWARNARASEAVPIQNTPSGKVPLGTHLDEEISTFAAPQDGASQVGILIQTVDTSAVRTPYGIPGGIIDGMAALGVCSEASLAQWQQWEAGEPGVLAPACIRTQAEWDAFSGPLNAAGTAKYGFRDASNLPQAPEFPFCDDYSPVDSVPGTESGPEKESPFRDQCWDGYRTMIEVTTDWKFYFLPFDEMRQAGWGRVGKDFRIDQIRSVNLFTSAFQPANVMVDEISFYRRAP